MQDSGRIAGWDRVLPCGMFFQREDNRRIFAMGESGMSGDRGKSLCVWDALLSCMEMKCLYTRGSVSLRGLSKDSGSARERASHVMRRMYGRVVL